MNQDGKKGFCVLQRAHQVQRLLGVVPMQLVDRNIVASGQSQEDLGRATGQGLLSEASLLPLPHILSCYQTTDTYFLPGVEGSSRPQSGQEDSQRGTPLPAPHCVLMHLPGCMYTRRAPGLLPLLIRTLTLFVQGPIL